MMRKSMFVLCFALMFTFALSLNAKILHIQSAAQFSGRQSRPLRPIKAVEIKPLNIKVGMNLPAARMHLGKAIARTKAEIAAIDTFLRGQAKRINSAKKHIAQFEAIKRDAQAKAADYQEEIEVLRNIENPSQPILDCIAKLEEEMAKAKDRVRAMTMLIKKMKARIAYINELTKKSKQTRADLQMAVTKMQQAKKLLGKANIPKPKNPDVLGKVQWKPIKIKAPKKGKPGKVTKPKRRVNKRFR